MFPNIMAERRNSTIKFNSARRKLPTVVCLAIHEVQASLYDFPTAMYKKDATDSSKSEPGGSEVSLIEDFKALADSFQIRRNALDSLL